MIVHPLAWFIAAYGRQSFINDWRLRFQKIFIQAYCLESHFIA